MLLVELVLWFIDSPGGFDWTSLFWWIAFHIQGSITAARALPIVRTDYLSAVMKVNWVWKTYQ